MRLNELLEGLHHTTGAVERFGGEADIDDFVGADDVDDDFVFLFDLGE